MAALAVTAGCVPIAPPVAPAPGPSLSVANIQVLEGSSGTTKAVLRVVLSARAVKTVRVHFATTPITASAPSDFATTNGDLVFAPGNTVRKVAVPVAGDNTVELDETFRLGLSAPVNALVTRRRATATITNDDTTALSIAGASAFEGTTSAHTVDFPVALSNPSASPITVGYATTDGTAHAGTDYVATAGTLTFAPGTTNTTISVPTLADDIVEPDRTFTVTLTNPTGASIVDAIGTGTVADDDTTGLSIAGASAFEGTTSAHAVDFPVALSNPSASPITVDYATTDGTAHAGTDYVAQAGTLTFAPGTTSTTISVATLADDIVEPDRTFTVALADPTGAPIVDAIATGIIADDDIAGLSIGSASVDEGTAAANAAGLSATLSNSSASTITVDYVTTDGTAHAGTDYVAKAGTLTFAPGTTSTTLSVPTMADATIESDETLTVGLHAATGATIVVPDGSVTIINDDFGAGPAPRTGSFSLEAWGSNSSGQLGDPSVASRVMENPSRVGSDSDWTQVSVSGGADRTMAVKSDGTLWGWGSNSLSVLTGSATPYVVSTPLQIGSDADWKTIEQSGYTAIALKTDGSLWTWGEGRLLGDGTTQNRPAPARVGAATDWATIAPAGNHMFAIKTDHSLWAWGWNHGEYGDGTTTPGSDVPVQVGTRHDWVQVSAGSENAAALRSDGTIRLWGTNTDGQFGDGTTARVTRTTATQVGTDTDWASVTDAGNNVFGIKTDGSLWGWGDNSDGQLGDGSFTDRATPIRIGGATTWSSVVTGRSTLAIRSDGTLWGWGYNGGALGDGHGGGVTLPEQIGTAADWQAIRTQGATAAIDADGELWMWGDNFIDQLGLGTTQRNDIEPVTTAKRWAVVSAGNGLAAGVADDGTLWTWGGVNPGYVFNSDYDYVPRQVGTDDGWVTVSAGTSHFAAIKSDGTLWTWGYNRVGELGDGTTDAHFTPQRVGTGTHWVRVQAGEFATFAIRSDGSLWTWGQNSYGQLGDGTVTGVLLSPHRVDDAIDWQDISFSQYHPLALKTDGTLWSWGSNNGGQVGDGTTVDRTVPTRVAAPGVWIAIAAGATSSAAIRADGTLWSWGGNSSGILGDGTTTNRSTPTQVGVATNWTSIAFSATLSAAATSADGTLWTWGRNDSATLGDAAVTQRLSPAVVGTATNWVRVIGGGGVVFALEA